MRRPRIPVPLAIMLTAVAAVPVAAPSAAQAAPERDPVILVAGTFSPSVANTALAVRLERGGYDVTVFQLPTLGMQSIRKSARALNAFADELRARKGAVRVDLVGHSQGGLVARSYVKHFGGAAEVDSLVTLGTPNRGTIVADLAEKLGFGTCLGVRACQQMTRGSRFLRKLNAGDDTIGSVRYTTFRTIYDQLVRPVGTATLRDGAVNVKIQAQCRLRIVGHVGLIFDGTVYSGVRQALEGRDAIELRCLAL